MDKFKNCIPSPDEVLDSVDMPTNDKQFTEGYRSMADMSVKQMKEGFSKDGMYTPLAEGFNQEVVGRIPLKNYP